VTIVRLSKIFLIVLLAVFSTQAQSNHKVTLTWSPSSTADVINYRVFRGTTSGGESATPIATTVAPACNNAGSPCTFQDTNVVAGQTYFYYVESYDGTNQSVPSNEISVTVPVSPVVGLGVTSSN